MAPKFARPGTYRKFPEPMKESISATTDLIKTTQESIRKSWGTPIEDQIVKDYLSDMKMVYSIPGTIEDEMPAVSQAFADKVKAEGGIMTPVGLICDPTVPVTGKRYMRLAKAFFCNMETIGSRHVEDVEYRIRNYAKRNKQLKDFMGVDNLFAEYLEIAFRLRHKPFRTPVYANKE